MNDSLKFVVPGKPEFIGPVRIAVAALASEMGFDVEAVEDIKLAVSEACSKAICPGTAGLGLYEVTCEVAPDKMTITVLDREGGCHLACWEDTCVECNKQEGLGLTVLKALMDCVSVYEEEHVGTGVRMCKNLHR